MLSFMMKTLHSFASTSWSINLTSSLNVAGSVNFWRSYLRGLPSASSSLVSVFACRQLAMIAFEALNETLMLMGRRQIPFYVQSRLDIVVAGLGVTFFYLQKRVFQIPIEGNPYTELERLSLLQEIKEGLNKKHAPLVNQLTEEIDFRKKRAQTRPLKIVQLLFDSLSVSSVITVLACSVFAIIKKKKYVRLTEVAFVALDFFPHFESLKKIGELAPGVIGLFQPGSLLSKLFHFGGKIALDCLLKYRFKKNKKAFADFVRNVPHAHLTDDSALYKSLVDLKAEIANGEKVS